MAIPLPTDAAIDYLGIAHRNIYRLPRLALIKKKYLRLIENEIDESRGGSWP